MMRMSNIKMTSKVERLKLLAAVRENYARHQTIVAEARKGYLAAASDALLRKMGQIRDGIISPLAFTLQVPQDHSEVYKNSIEMLEWNTQEHVELEADEFRQLVRDEWDFTETFLLANLAYSATARGTYQERK